MARMCIDINRIKNIYGDSFYEVVTSDEGGAHFYVNIDRNKRQVDVFLNKNFDFPDISINTAIDQDISHFKEIPSPVLLRVIWRCMQTFEQKELPDSLSFCS